MKAEKIKGIGLSLVLAAALALTGCVDQHPESESSAEGAEDTDSISGSSEASGSEDAAVNTEEMRLVATTPSIMNICNMLELDLVGIPDTSSDIPERYQDATRCGSAMNPDLEIIASLDPTEVLMTGGSSTSAVSSLIPGQAEKTESVDLPTTYLNVASVEGLYESITYLGEKYGKEELAEGYVQEYEDFLAEYQEKIADKEKPKVLILMGLPGSYIEATPNSYVGSLVEMAGGVNVVSDDSDEAFLTWNTEELYQLDPDIILLTAHGIPDAAMEMFSEEFTTNTIWQNFSAVQNGKIYKLDYSIFNMSATFDWTEGLEDLYEIFYEDGGEHYEP